MSIQNIYRIVKLQIKTSTMFVAPTVAKMWWFVIELAKQS